MSQGNLFDMPVAEPVYAAPPAPIHPTEAVDYFPTPRWASDLIVRTFYDWLRPGHRVLEPTCGAASWLQALPAGVDALGVELDPELAEYARQCVPFPIITGDITKVQLEPGYNLILGNPPFDLALVDLILERSHELLVDDGTGECGFVLPAYAFQTAGRVVGYNRDWSLESHMIPRNLYSGLSKPLVFARFRKDGKRTLVGMLLYRETDAVNRLPSHYKTLFVDQGAAPLWPLVVEQALIRLGGEASLEHIYREIEGNRPTENAFWKPQVRKVLQSHFRRTAPATYALNLSH